MPLKRKPEIFVHENEPLNLDKIRSKETKIEKETPLEAETKTEKEGHGIDALSLSKTGAIAKSGLEREEELNEQKRIKEIEDIMSSELEQIYSQMSAKEQKIFKAEGEKTARKINELIKQAKLSLKKLIKLLRSWLKLIPGVNRFFLEQESKIKADRIMKIKK